MRHCGDEVGIRERSSLPLSSRRKSAEDAEKSSRRKKLFGLACRYCKLHFQRTITAYFPGAVKVRPSTKSSTSSSVPPMTVIEMA